MRLTTLTLALVCSAPLFAQDGTYLALTVGRPGDANQAQITVDPQQSLMLVRHSGGPEGHALGEQREAELSAQELEGFFAALRKGLSEPADYQGLPSPGAWTLSHGPHVKVRHTDGPNLTLRTLVRSLASKADEVWTSQRVTSGILGASSQGYTLNVEGTTHRLEPSVVAKQLDPFLGSRVHLRGEIRDGAFWITDFESPCPIEPTSVEVLASASGDVEIELGDDGSTLQVTGPLRDLVARAVGQRANVEGWIAGEPGDEVFYATAIEAFVVDAAVNPNAPYPYVELGPNGQGGVIGVLAPSAQVRVSSVAGRSVFTSGSAAPAGWVDVDALRFGYRQSMPFPAPAGAASGLVDGVQGN